MANFHTKMNNIFETGTINQSVIDCELTLRLRDDYEIEVLCSGFSSGRTPDGKIQGNFHALISLQNSKNEAIRALRSLKGMGNYGVTISLPKYGEEFRKFAETLMRKYSELANLNPDDYDEIYVTVYDFRASAVNRLYGKAYSEIADFMQNKFHIDRRDIIGIEDSKFYILADSIEEFTSMIVNKAEIYERTFSVMKRYDSFSCLDYKDLKISIFLKDLIKCNRHLA